MTQDDAQTIVQSLVRSVTDDAAEDALLRVPHLEWVLITATESLPQSEAALPQISADRGVITCWVTPAGLFKTVVAVLRQDKSSPLYASLGTAGWPFPEQVTTIGIEHCMSIAKGEPGDALMTTWSFRYPDEELHLIKGVVVSVPESSAADSGAEAFARSIAGKVGWRVSDSAGAEESVRDVR